MAKPRNPSTDEDYAAVLHCLAIACDSLKVCADDGSQTAIETLQQIQEELGALNIDLAWLEDV